MSLLDKFRVPSPATAPRPAINEVFGRTSIGYPEGSFFAEISSRRAGVPVSNSKDLQRVLALPRRARPDVDPAPLIARLGLGPVSCRCAEFSRPCATTLRPIQAWALTEAPLHGGLLGPIGVGDGKTLLNLLTPMVMPGCRTAMLLIPPDMKAQLLEMDWSFYAQHWQLPNLTTGRWSVPGRPWLHVVTFSELSNHRATDLLERIAPDLVVVDEAHCLRRRSAARTKRFLRYMHAHTDVRLCAWSGTLTSKSLRDYAHLSALALKDGSPLPLAWPAVEDWASAIDPGEDFPAPIGALSKLCEPGEHVNSGFRRRLHDTPGVVASSQDGNCNASIIFRERKTTLPKVLEMKLRELHRTWRRPDQEELVSALDKARCAREMACGFFYRWRWPRNEPMEVRARWLAARAEWHRELREKLKHSKPHLDSPLLCAKAAIRFYDDYEGDLPVWPAEAWPEWALVRGTARPETEAVWEDDWLLRDAAAWLKSNTGIVWYEHDTFGRRLADLAHVPFYGPGEEASSTIVRERGDRSIIAGIRSHHRAKNLQMFSRQLVANPPSDGATWEQLIGRTHRPGQGADEVVIEVYRHTEDMRDALDKARALAAYIEGTMGGQQKLLRASFGWL